MFLPLLLPDSRSGRVVSYIGLLPFVLFLRFIFSAMLSALSVPLGSGSSHYYAMTVSSSSFLCLILNEPNYSANIH